MRHSEAINEAGRVVSRASNSRVMDKLARFGFVAKGLVYLVVGVLAFLAAFTSSGEVTDTKGAVKTIGAQPGGDLLLMILAAGLFGYASWRFIDAFANSENDNAVKRIGCLISGLVYTSLGIFAMKLALDASASSPSAEDWTAKLMAKPFGIWMVGLVGFAIIGYGAYQIYKGAQERFREHLSGMNARQAEAATRMGKVGHIARGIVFAIVGCFLIVAATNADPNEAVGFDGALVVLARQPYGPWLLGLTAVGLMAYGLYYVMFESRFHRVAP